jgi:formylglycine-generating enzyme required for sulfatase activity
MGSTGDDVDAAVQACARTSVIEPVCRPFLEREKPQHRIFLDAFYLDKHEVTNALFGRFTSAMSYRTTAELEGKSGVWDLHALRWFAVDGASWRAPLGPGSQTAATDPVVQVSWADADAYCRWAGKRLPTEAEWEKAARGTDGRKYPWGNEWEEGRSNFNGGVFGSPMRVGSFAEGASPHGALDMAGNVWEWVADWFDRAYYGQSPTRNPSGPVSGRTRVLRGGSWYHDQFLLRAAMRYDSAPSNRYYSVGFRCARNPP